MIILPQLAYIGHAFINYTIANTGAPSVTPRGTGFWDTFTSGKLSFISGPPSTPMTISEIERFESDLSSAASTVNIIAGGDYFTQLSSPSPGYLELDSQAVGKEAKSGALVRFTADGFIKINEKVGAIFTRSPNAKTMEFGETDFWEPIKVDTGDKSMLWLNAQVVFSQGRLLVENGAAYGMELRLFTLVNGKADSQAQQTQNRTEETSPNAGASASAGGGGGSKVRMVRRERRF